MFEFFIIYTIVSLIFTVAYVLIVFRYLAGWGKLSTWEPPPSYTPSTKVTVIIPARNEANQLPACLSSISKLRYPASLLEVIVVDDHSTDETFAIAKAFQDQFPPLKVLKLADYLSSGHHAAFKKMAIGAAIQQSTGALIITTDADCEVQEDWLMLFASFFEAQRPVFIAAPVNFHRETSLFERFQSLDFLGMMGVTGAGVQLNWMNMCNGANLAYTRAAFHEVNGFEGIDQLASGDDMLLMQKIAARYPRKIGFLKNTKATVFTTAKADLPSFVSQRLRWATKSASYREWKVTGILAVVFFYCCLIIGCLLLIPIFGWNAGILLVLLFLLKSLADYFFLGEMADYFNRSDLMRSFIASQILHVLYVSAIGFLGNIKKNYVWKDRKVR